MRTFRSYILTVLCARLPQQHQESGRLTCQSRKPHVAEAIQKAKAERSERTGITADYVLEVVRDTVERCRAVKAFDPRAVLRGAELLGKHLGLFDERLRVTDPGGKNLNFTINLVKPKESE